MPQSRSYLRRRSTSRPLGGAQASARSPSCRLPQWRGLGRLAAVNGCRHLPTERSTAGRGPRRILRSLRQPSRTTYHLDFRERCASKTTPAQEASRPTLSARAMVAAALPKFARRRRVPCPSLRRSELRNKRTVRVRVALWRLRRLPPTFPRNRPRLRVHLHARRRRQHPRSYPPDLRPRAPPPGQGRPRP